MKTVAIFRRQLLPISETFIPEQSEHVPGYTPLYTGVRRDDSGQHSLPNAEIISETDGPWSAARFALTGRPPRAWLNRIARHEPALVHAHFGPDATDAIPLAAALAVPLAATFHGFDITITRRPWPNKRFALYLYRRGRLFDTAARIIAVSDFIRERLIAAGCDASKIVRHYIGVDIERFVATGAPRGPIILFVGRLVEKKGCTHLLRALTLDPSLRRAQTVIIGGGPERQRLEQYAVRNHLNVLFLGPQPIATIRGWMDRARVLCVPSVTASNGDAEAFGIVFIEAQSMSLPVVSFRSGGIAEAVADGITGLLADEFDTHGLAARLASVMNDDSLWMQLSAAGRARVVRMFNLTAQCRSLGLLYDGILDADLAAYGRTP